MKTKYILLLVVLSLFVFVGCNKENKNSSIILSEGTDYNVKGEFTGNYLDISKRGYYVDTLNQPDAPYLYIICMGEKNTGGYDLKVKEVRKSGEKVEVIVEEITPAEGDIVTMAFTSPTVTVEFPKYQENIIIKNTSGDIFNKLN